MQGQSHHFEETVRSTLGDWIAWGGLALQRLTEPMLEHVRAQFLVGIDATGLRVLDSGPDRVHRGTFHQYRGASGLDRPATVVFDYTPTGEAEDGPWRVLAGHTGYVQADASNSFDRLFNGKAASATEVGCHFHARRPFKNNDTDTRTAFVLQLVRRLFRLEALARAVRDARHRPASVKKSLPDVYLSSETRELLASPVFLSRTDYIRNLAGWVTSATHASDEYGETSDTTYDPRGLVASVTDPSGQLTTTTYTAFAEVAARTLPHNTTQPNERWTYDGYGRVTTHETADGEVIAAEYDGRGDLVRQRWATYTGGGSDVLTQFVWDDLGRRVGATDTNLGRSRVGLPAMPVFRTWTRDALDRVLMETTQVGTTAPRVTTSNWQLQPDGWTRQLTYPSGKIVTRHLDEIGRLAAVQVGARAISMEYVGTAYTGRTHAWSSSAAVDPMRHFVGLDGLGRGVDFATTMLDRSATGTPTNTAWADDYCEGSYDADLCGAPIFAQQLVRDAQGRTRSVSTLWGNPERGPLSERAAPWRGYNYDAEGRLTTVFEHDGIGETVSAMAVPSHSVRNADLWNLTNAYATSEAPILPVHWEREPDVGGLTAVVEQDGATRWANGGRLPGHQLSSVSLDEATQKPGVVLPWRLTNQARRSVRRHSSTMLRHRLLTPPSAPRT